VLVIDGDATTRHQIRDALFELRVTIDVASELDDAAFYASSRRYDAIISPAEQYELVRQLQRDSAPTIILTKTRSSQPQNTGVTAVKPSEVARAVKLLERTLGEKKPAVIRLPGLTIDTRTKEVVRGRHRIVLTRREYSLLEYLAARAGQVVSVAEISTRLYAHERSSNLITVYVGYLRKKLGPPPIILTEHGVGYTILE